MKPLSVLFVDDDKLQRLKFKKVCKEIELDIIVYEAVDGENAMSILNSNKKIDLVVSDLNMPKMNGLELLSELKNNITLKNIPFVIMSTSKRAKDLKKSLKLGVTAYYNKPTKYKDYVKKVISLLTQWNETLIIQQ